MGNIEIKCETNKRAIFLSCTHFLFLHFKFIKMLFERRTNISYKKKMNKSLSKSTNFPNVITITTLLVIERTGDSLYVFIQG